MTDDKSFRIRGLLTSFTSGYPGEIVFSHLKLNANELDVINSMGCEFVITLERVDKASWLHHD